MGAQSGSAGGGATELVSLLTAKAARDLSLDMGTTTPKAQ